MHRIHHGLIGVGACDRQHFGKAVLDASCIGAEAARDDHSPRSARASPMASRDSSTAASIKPQVLTMTRSASA